MAKLKIDVNDLHKYYGENEVLKGITTKFTKEMWSASSAPLALENQLFYVA